MIERFLGLKDLKEDKDKNSYKLQTIAWKDIAVIGISAKISGAENATQLWEALKSGEDMVRDYPESRKNSALKLLDFLYLNNSEKLNSYQFTQGGFIENIDEFDYRFFGISPREAGLMDPCQRIFLQAVWEAVEDAGYGGTKLKGTRTGVYVGHSSDFGEEYKRLIQVTAPSSAGLAVAGNIKSIIATRISYLLDLKGPALLVDTACSSSLTAIHLACQGIRNKECDYAIAGGVKINLLPEKTKKMEEGIGIESSDGRTRSFDDSSDGTGIGEGVGAVLLKPLSRAVADNDHIYAVIKGSALNQDGKTIGITAPNSSAQQSAIVDAWKDSDIDPETITYIEAHGTGTKLGDPVEISGITHAFEEFTHKKQFCAIGSIKSNTGHLDHAAGIAAFLKVVLSLKHKQIPPSLYFNRPNRKIAFTETPVYMNDRLSEWKTDSKIPRRCGINSFGLSGTNCHLVLEEAPGESQLDFGNESSTGAEILTLSALNKESLKTVLVKYYNLLENEKMVSLADLCYTANTGRGQYPYRCAVITDEINELKEKLLQLILEGFENGISENIFYGHHKLITSAKSLKDSTDLTQEEKMLECNKVVNLIEEYKNSGETDQKLMKEICMLYVRGADVNWEVYYNHHIRKKLSLPTYPFQKNRCWFEPEEDLWEKKTKEKTDKKIHPLIDTCLAESNNIRIYSTVFQVRKYWELNEHQIFGTSVLPGTAYLEMVREAANKYFPDNIIELKEVVFLSPFIAEDKDSTEIHTILKDMGSHLEFSISGITNTKKEWITYAQGQVWPADKSEVIRYSMSKLFGEFSEPEPFEVKMDGNNKVQNEIVVGPHFYNLKKTYVGDEKVLAYLELEEKYYSELKEYVIHPALLDSAVNLANPALGPDVYLPMYYNRIHINSPLPAKFFSYVRKRGKNRENAETGNFDIVLLNTEGLVLMEIEGYTVKRIHNSEIRKKEIVNDRLNYYSVNWIEKKLKEQDLKNIQGTILVLKGKNTVSKKIFEEMYTKEIEIIEVESGDCFKKINNKMYIIGDAESDYLELMQELKYKKLDKIIHMFTLDGYGESDVEFVKRQEQSILSLFFLVKTMLQTKINSNQLTNIIILSSYANKVTGDENYIYPLHNAMFGLGKTVTLEYAHLKVRCIDIDKATSSEKIRKEILCGENFYQIAYRNGIRFVQEVDEAEIKNANRIEYQSAGVYLITGGAGSLGFEIVKHIGKKAKVNIAVVGRSEIPKNKEWEALLKSGVRLEYFKADISDTIQVKNLIDNLKSRFGKINGVVHCAGIAGDGFLIRKDTDEFRKVISPKIYGTWLLDKFTREESLDFFVMFSSITALTGDMGQGDYGAANAFQDAFASVKNRQTRKILSINWPAWSTIGMAAKSKQEQGEPLFYPILPHEGVLLFDAALESGLTNLIPGRLNDNYIETDRNQPSIGLSDKIVESLLLMKQKKNIPYKKVQSESDINHVVLFGRNKGEYSQLEYELGLIWGRILGIEHIDIYDNFNDLGGNSISAVRVLKEMEMKFSGVVDISDIFTYSSIAEMSEYITKETKVCESTDIIKEDIDSILVKLANGLIDVEDANRFLD